MQGLYRYNDRWDNVNIHALRTHEDGTEQLYAKLYANTVEIPLQSIADDRDRIAELGISVSSDPNGGGIDPSQFANMGGAADAGTQGGNDDGVVDADFTEV